ncbi:PAS domain-containing protein [Segetibacter koreensis]|uniref:PAS domain-containing protein n=1 Tax=Segetibacter koreensis TaxID=398037 RepID=UPI000374A318|nr:PAS domain-containing protein [Segetibacter koreensis]
MNKIPEGTSDEKSGISKQLTRATEDTLHHLAFDYSLQPNIISLVSSGKIITANIAACKLLGYSKKELLTKSRAAIFDVNDSSFRKMLKQRTAEGQSTGVVNLIKKDGGMLQCEITSAIFIDEGIEKAITSFVDLSQSILKQKNIDTKKDKIVAANIVIAQAKSDVRLAENNEWIKYIAKNSYDVMWDWDILSGDIYVGDSIVEVFGYKVENNMVNLKDLKRCLLPKEKEIVEKKLHDILASDSKSWKDSFTFKRHDGSAAFTTCRASIVRDEDRKAVRMIGALHDVSRLQELENKLEEQIEAQEGNSQRFVLAAKLAFDVIWDWNILTDELFLGEGFEDCFGYTLKNNRGNMSDLRNHIYPGDKELVIQKLQDAVASSDRRYEHSYRFIKADRSITTVFDRATILRDVDGKAYRMIGVMQDIGMPLQDKLSEHGLTDDRKTRLIKNIKNIIIELVHYSEEQLQTNFSDHLSKKLQYDYTYLANLFSEQEGISIQKFIIAQKIERVKDLLVDHGLTLTQIATKLHYSSVAHLSNQFKKVTGFTPSLFVQLKDKGDATMEIGMLRDALTAPKVR